MHLTHPIRVSLLCLISPIKASLKKIIVVCLYMKLPIAENKNLMPLDILSNNRITTNNESQAIINLVNEIKEAKPVLLQKFIRRYV